MNPPDRHSGFYYTQGVSLWHNPVNDSHHSPSSAPSSPRNHHSVLQSCFSYPGAPHSALEHQRPLQSFTVNPWPSQAAELYDSVDTAQPPDMTPHTEVHHQPASFTGPYTDLEQYPISADSVPYINQAGFSGDAAYGAMQHPPYPPPPYRHQTGYYRKYPPLKYDTWHEVYPLDRRGRRVNSGLYLIIHKHQSGETGYQPETVPPEVTREGATRHFWYNTYECGCFVHRSSTRPRSQTKADSADNTATAGTQTTLSQSNPLKLPVQKEASQLRTRLSTPVAVSNEESIRDSFDQTSFLRPAGRAMLGKRGWLAYENRHEKSVQSIAAGQTPGKKEPPSDN